VIRSPVLRAALAVSLCLASLAAAAQPAERRSPKHAPAPPPAEAPPPPELSAPPPYEPQLLRLAEVLGALHHLRTVCTASDADVWRDRMAALIEADAPTPERRDRLAGAFNASFRTWARSYRSCTPAADVAVKRFLQEAGKLASEVRQRYGP